MFLSEYYPLAAVVAIRKRPSRDLFITRREHLCLVRRKKQHQAPYRDPLLNCKLGRRRSFDNSF